MRLLWKLHLDNDPRQMHALSPALIMAAVRTATGSKEVAVVAGVSDNLYGIDAERGVLLWKRHFDFGFSRPRSYNDPRCPGGQTATPVIAPAPKPGAYFVYAVSWDGRLRTLDAATGEEIEPAAPFMPPNGKPYALNLWGGVIYTTTAQRCGGNPNLLYAYDLATKTVSTLAPTSGGMWGRTGPSIGTDGTVYTGTGDGIFDPDHRRYGQAIIAVKRDSVTKRLSVKDYFSPANAEWLRLRDLDMSATGPLFTYAGHEYIVQSSKECRVWLLDTRSLGGGDHRTPVDSTPLICNEDASASSAGVWGALATWEDSSGVRWVLSPFWGAKAPGFHAPIEHGATAHGAIVAFKVEETGGKPHLVPAWISRDMNMAEPPVVANGVVFGYGSGESTRQYWPDPRHLGGTAGRIAESTHAVLYALDGQTGEELWSSGDQVPSWNHFSGLSVANGQVFIGTYDGNLYSFAAQPPSR